MHIRVTIGRSPRPNPTLGVRVLFEGRGLLIEGTDRVREVSLRGGRRLWLAGNPVGLLAGSGTMSELVALPQELADASPVNLQDLEGRYVGVVIDPSDESCWVAADRFGQMDVYYQAVDGGSVLGTELRLLPVAATGAPFDQVALAHTLCVYGHRPAKQQTPYAGVKRLGVGESVSIKGGRLQVQSGSFRPIETAAYGERELHEYADLLLQAVRIRGSRHGNVVYLSSGWDSTSLLACLVHLYGARKVRAVIGRMKYSERSGVINQFEIDRAKAVAEFFGVHLDIIEFDYWRRGPELVEELSPLFRGHHIATLTGLNHSLLANHVAETTEGDESLFAGEISDGAHNLGFSQFVTIFHPSLEFREYSDKMASYLFGPTFLQLLQHGRFADDPIYQLLRSRVGSAVFDEVGGEEERTRQMLASFFLRPNRLPLWSLRNTRVLTHNGRDTYSASMEQQYLERAGRDATPKTLYSWYLHLYNSFHWQGSTVVTLGLTAEAKGLRAALPFWDSRLQEFLSAMPESWGRGLDLNPTKYPLKWALTHRIRFPMHLQVGPHSYLYDVDPSFSHGAEILYGSAFASYYRDLLRHRAYRDVLSEDTFDLGYLDGVVQRYLDGVEVRGSEMNDLLSLCILTATGWYGVR